MNMVITLKSEVFIYITTLKNYLVKQVPHVGSPDSQSLYIF